MKVIHSLSVVTIMFIFAPIFAAEVPPLSVFQIIGLQNNESLNDKVGVVLSKEAYKKRCQDFPNDSCINKDRTLLVVWQPKGDNAEDDETDFKFVAVKNSNLRPITPKTKETLSIAESLNIIYTLQELSEDAYQETFARAIGAEVYSKYGSTALDQIVGLLRTKPDLQQWLKETWRDLIWAEDPSIGQAFFSTSEKIIIGGAIGILAATYLWPKE